MTVKEAIYLPSNGEVAAELLQFACRGSNSGESCMQRHLSSRKLWQV